jgi:hypothetical protein
VPRLREAVLHRVIERRELLRRVLSHEVNRRRHGTSRAA